MAALAPAADFTLVGAPALLATNETTPPGFYEPLRRAARLDGFVLGPGCGNVLAMLEGFAAPPRGLILVDVDPAVVCAGRMLAACLARHPRREDFVRDFFCGGEAALASLEREVVAAADTSRQRHRMEAQHGRLWEGLARVAEGFRYRPDDAAAWLGRWLEPALGAPARGLPVLTLLARNHDALHALAAAGDIAVLEASLFDPALLAAVAALPGFAAAGNLVYLSNAADHVLRRAVFAAAKARLGIEPPPDAPGLPRSPAEFLAMVNDAHLGRLQAVAGGDRPTHFVYCTTRDDLILRQTAAPPRYGAADLEVKVDLEQAIRAFFGAAATTSPPPAGGPGGEGWDAAASLRRAASRLYGAAVSGDGPAAGAALAQMLGAGPPPAPPPAASYLAFWTAELGQSMLALASAGLASGAPWDAALGRLGTAAAWLFDHGEPPAAASYLHRLAWGAALAAAGRLLGAETLAAAGRRALGHAPPPAASPGQGGEAAGEGWEGWEAEALLRLVSAQLHLPAGELSPARAELARRLCRAVGPGGAVAPARLAAAPGTAAPEPYLRFAAQPEAIVDAACRSLLLHGLLAEEMGPIDTALRIVYHARSRADGAALEPHVVFDRLVEPAHRHAGG